MIMEAFLPVDEISSLRKLLRSGADRALPFSEIYVGKFLLIGGPGCSNCPYLEKVPLIYFFSEFQTFLRQNKSVKHAAATLMDPNQFYSVEARKSGDEFTLSTTLGGVSCEFTGRYFAAKNRVEFAINRFFADLLGFCPEFERSIYMDEARKMFYINIF